MSQEKRGAALQKVSTADRLEHWRQHHAEEAVASLRRLRSTPLATAMTWLVIAIALALPLGLAKILGDARQLVQNWSGNAQVSLYLQKNLPEASQNQLREQLQQRADVDHVQAISPADALAEFKANSGYGDAVDLLGSNPLPPVLVVFPKTNDPNTLDSLRDEFAQLPGVSSADVDSDWVEKLAAMLDVGNRLLLALGLALTAAVLLVVGNTIRAGIESRRNEIVVIKLLGASNAFVRRPFLYMGLWSGLFGGIIALVSVALFTSWLSSPVNHLAQLYNSDFHLSHLHPLEVMGMLAFSCGLGLLGALLAVTRHLRELEPK